MMYTVFLTKQSVKECKKRGSKFKQTVINIIQKLSSNPRLSKSEKLTGKFHFVYSYHFNFAGCAYRLAYILDDGKKTLTVVMIEPRENFYQILRRRLRS